ncbi:MAG: sugar phosphate isomerase/epimerase [Clostridia bacterium]|nr:sugar phosphate isomerase/epimerase [Clostridia bacterium]MBP5657452.1 sugar phosphate isomerase/epimerase [Clostridia bacterium]
MKIGIISDSLRLGFAESVKKAASLGAQGIQKYMTYGDFAAENLTPARLAEIRDIMDSNGMVFSAICGDFGWDLTHPNVVEKSKAVLEKTKELGCNIVTTHIGRIDRTDDARNEILRKNALALAEYAHSMGAYFASETGTEKAADLRWFLDTVGVPGIAVNLDPANLVMCADDDPVAAVKTLAPYIVHTHAKDGIRRADGTWLEVPLGKGGVKWPEYLKALDSIGYKGYLTIEREVGDDPAGDIGMAVDFLKENLSAI